MYFVDKWGRKALLLLGAFGLTFIYALMGSAYFFHISGTFLLVIVVLAIACYAMTLAPVMWIVISEIYPNRIRGIAMSVATFALWTACFILTLYFPLAKHGFRCCRNLLVVRPDLFGRRCVCIEKVPETKGKTLEELENELIKK